MIIKASNILHYTKFQHSSSLISFIINQFSTDTVNWRVPFIDPYTNKVTDQHLLKYHNLMFNAYLQKRKIKRSQIWPKIHIIDQIPQEESQHLQYQKLFPIKKLLDDEVMKKIVKEDPTQINSAFIISVFSQDHFKQLIDQYVSKTLVSGKAPSQQSYKKMQQIKQKVISLYKTFYFGQKLLPLQRQIQLNYLAAKQDKYIRSQYMPKNPYLKCRWRDQDQRLLQQMLNWNQIDLNLSDLSYRPYFQPLLISSRLPHVQKLYSLLGDDTFLSRWNFDRKIRKQYQYSMKYLNWIKQKIFSRTVQYIRCLQFTNTLKIPPDFMIQLCILNIHFWLIIDRLKQINTKKTKNLAILLQQQFNIHLNQTIGSLNIKKVAVAKRNFNEILAIAKNALNLHFKTYKQTKQNPYLDIDALVWSIALRQKVQRYSDQVYLFGEYLIKNYQHLRNFNQQDFLDAVVQFDCFLYDPDYKQKIVAINPPLSKQQFEEQFKSNKANKKYYYKYNENMKTIHLQFGEITKNRTQSVEYSFIGSLAEKIVTFYRKYLTNLDNYDHYSEMDKQKAQAEISSKKSPWQGPVERLNKVNQQFASIEQIRRNRARNRERSSVQFEQNINKDGQKSKQNQNKK